ncbi:glycosyltransferase family 2 protein [Chloroflexota bacterium]
MPQPLVISIILNTNRRADTLACLASLQASKYENREVIVLDNNSTDGSPQAIRSEFPNVRIIPIKENLGYAGNNNVGIRAALELGAEWVFILNEDTILDPDCLELLVQAGERDARTGILGPMVYHHDEPDLIQSAGGMLGAYWQGCHLGQNRRDLGQYHEPHCVDWISGCAIMLRRAVIEQVGMLDERFYYYWEETEWCLRAGKSGWRIVHIPAAKLWHKGVQRDYTPKPFVTYYSTRNHLLLLAKHHAPLKAWLYNYSQILRTLTSWTVKPKWRNMKGHRDAMWHGLNDFLQHHWGQMPP